MTARRTTRPPWALVALAAARGRVRMTVDVDPQSLL